jgi:hypothetical protein
VVLTERRREKVKFRRRHVPPILEETASCLNVGSKEHCGSSALWTVAKCRNGLEEDAFQSQCPDVRIMGVSAGLPPYIVQIEQYSALDKAGRAPPRSTWSNPCLMTSTL